MNKYFQKYNNQLVVIYKNLPEKAANTNTVNELYAAVYEEFFGANDKKEYKNLSIAQRIDCVNQFTEKWLKARGLF